MFIISIAFQCIIYMNNDVTDSTVTLINSAYIMVNVCMCGYMAMWLCGSVAMWFCGYVTMWLYGYMVFMYVHVGVAIPPYQQLPLWVPGEGQTTRY